MQVQLQAQIKKIETMADRGMGIKLHTQELAEAEKAKLFEFGQELVWLALSKAPVDKLDVPDVVPEFKDDKTPSQRLRAVIYRYWEHLGKPMAGFEVFYRTQLDALIDKYKEKLD